MGRRRTWRDEYPFEDRFHTNKTETLQVESSVQVESEGIN
jgi:hypothetical protein